MTRHVVVVGDVLLDVDLQTEANRLMPDAPAPVLTERGRVTRPGGAALAALLVSRVRGVRVSLIAALPDDGSDDQIRHALAGSVDVIALPASGRTPVKTRLRAGGHSVGRLDSGGGVQILSVPAEAREAIASADAVLVSDYGGPVPRHPEIRRLLGADAPVVWDPHPRGPEPIPSCALVTPNLAEALAATQPSRGGKISAGGATDAPRTAGVGPAREVAEALRRRWRAQSVAVTLGERGALLVFGTGSGEYFPVPRIATGDTCGAGDAFASAAVAEFARGALPSQAVSAAVQASAAFVAAGGAAGIGAADSPAHQDRVLTYANVRRRGGTVVATGGCFDLLHAGHIQTLTAARSLGDCLVVLLNSDESVRRAKGPSRPLQNQDDRARVLSALRCVDDVVIFDEDTPEQALRDLRPDVWVKGGDYSGHELPEAAAVRSWGGEVVTVDFLDGRSTSRLVRLAQE